MNHLRNITFELIAFITGFSVMVLEITATRLLAPFFGTSLFVWTNVIALVLGAMALGYYVGGRMAGRFDSLYKIGRVLCFSGILYIIVPVLIPALGRITPGFIDIATGHASPYIALLFFIACALVIAIPIFIISGLQPILVKYATDNGWQVGRSAGNISAWGTVGSIMGTILAGYVFVPYLGSRGTLFAIAVVLLLAGFLLTASDKRNRNTVIVGMVFIMALSMNLGSLKPVRGLIAEQETKYQFVQVSENEEGDRFLQFNEGAGVQTMYNPTNLQTDAYYDYYAVMPYLVNHKPSRVLIIGLAGGAMVHQLHAVFGEDIAIDAVEIDEGVVKIAQKYFGLNESLLTTYVADARSFLNQKQGPYDLIIVDAYAQEYYIPWTLTTVEFWNHVKDSLADGGVVAMNINSVSEATELLTGMQNTLASVFQYVYQAKPPPRESLNYILAASATPIPWNNLATGPAFRSIFPIHAAFLADSMERIEYHPEQAVFTDDHAPVEFLTDKMMWGIVRN